ncbi:MAG: type II toxin-antitoxin system RelE/ParE family toxin [Gemmataceae bacterium]|nr:type II toxin-antitoxin system RelE/ParE family toxin [Gemmataceae bacterium]
MWWRSANIYRPATAIRFGRAVTQTLNLLAALPEIGSPWESPSAQLAGMRFQNVRGFKNYPLFYRLTDTQLHILRIVDGRRDLNQLL